MHNSVAFRSAPLWLSALVGIVSALSTALNTQAQYSLTQMWSIATGVRSYVTAASNNDRGLAYNPVNDHVYIVSRAGGLKVAVLDGATGAEIKFLDVTGVSGGTFALSLIAVSDDGIIYGANLTTGSGTSPFKIYRWENEDAAPTVVYSGNPGGTANGRWGDNFDIRGSGQNTEMLAADGATAPASILAAIFKPADDPITTFNATTLTVAGAAALDLQKGLCFGTNNTFIAKRFGVATSLKYFTFDLGSATATAYLTNTIAAGVSAICLDTNTMLLVGVETANAASPHNLKMYDASVSGTLPGLGTLPFPEPYANNGNAVGYVDIGNSNVFAIDSNSGVIAARIQFVAAPQITADPADITVVQGGYASISADVTGVAPLYYQWFHDGNLLPNETNRFLNLTNITLGQGGDYTVQVTNIHGSAVSGPGTVTLTPTVLSSAMTLLWKVQPGDRPYINTDGSQRGLAYNPVNNHVLVVSRTGSNAIHVLNADTGEHLWSMNVDPSIVTEGTFAINLVDVGDDGVVYAGNLTQNGNFKLYRWLDDSEASVPQLIWGPGNPGGLGTGLPSANLGARWGDAMDVRGGSFPQVVLTSRNTNYVSIIDLWDINLAPRVAYLDTLESGVLGLGVAFGADPQPNAFTIWGTAYDRALRQIELVENTPNVLTATSIREFTGYLPMVNIAVEPASNLLAGISSELPDNVRLVDIINAVNGDIDTVDTEFFPTDNANANGTGAVAFGPNRIFALDSNNGLAAWSYSYERPACVAGNLTITRISATQVEISWTAPGQRLESTSDLSTTPTWQTIGNTSPATVTIGSGNQFFRLVCP